MKFSLSIILTIFLVICSFLLLLYTYYYSEILHSGSRIQFYKKYYFISFFLIIFTSSILLYNNEWRTRILIVFFSTIFTFFLIEIYLTIINLSKFKLTNYDKEEFYNIMKKKNPNITISMIPRNINSHLYSLSGISLKKTIYCKEYDYFSIFDSDRYGFNNPDLAWDQNKTKYLLVGDSFTLGSCVKEKNTIAGNLRSEKNIYSVINLGYSGNGPIKEYATLREYLPLLNAEKIFWLFYEGNDLLELRGELKHQLLIKYVNDLNFSQNLKLKQRFIDNHLSNAINEKLKSSTESIKANKFIKVINFLKLYYLRIYFLEPFFNELPYSEFEKIIKLTKEFANKNNSELYFIYIPTYENLNNKFINRYKDIYKNIISIVDEAKIKKIDLYKEFSKLKDPIIIYPFKDDGHLNELGYKIISKRIYSLN